MGDVCKRKNFHFHFEVSSELVTLGREQEKVIKAFSNAWINSSMMGDEASSLIFYVNGKKVKCISLSAVQLTVKTDSVTRLLTEIASSIEPNSLMPTYSFLKTFMLQLLHIVLALIVVINSKTSQNIH